MVATYLGTPGVDTAPQRRDAVRLTVGDARFTSDGQTNNAKVQDGEIDYALAQAGNDIIRASITIAKVILAQYADQVTSNVQGASANLSDRIMHYEALIAQLELDAENNTPTYSAVETPDPCPQGPTFYRGQFSARGSVPGTDTFLRR